MTPRTASSAKHVVHWLTATLTTAALAAGLGGCRGGYNSTPPPPPPPPAVIITTQQLPDATVGTSYSATLVAISGTKPFTWSVTSGTLPAGLGLVADTGAVSGTPTTPGTSTFTIKVTDDKAQTDTHEYTVTIGNNASPRVERVSVAFDGSQANGDSGTPSVSDDGRFIAFTSVADNLVANDTNNVGDVFVRDRQCGTTVLASVASDGTQGGSQSFAPSISALNGNLLFVAYVSDADNLVANDTNKARDVFETVLDTSSCPPVPVNTVRVSVASDGTEADGASNLPSISADGLTVAYDSAATTLAPNDNNALVDAFVTRLALAGTTLSVVSTERVSIAPAFVAIDIPTTTATVFTASTIGASGLTLTPGAEVGRLVRITGGTGSGQNRTITANDATTLTVSPDWKPVPDATSTFRIFTTENLTADVSSNTTIGHAALKMMADENKSRLVEIVGGTGQGQTRLVTGNDGTTLTVGAAWSPVPDSTSVFHLLEQGVAASRRARLAPDGNFVAFDTSSSFETDDTNNVADVFRFDLAANTLAQMSRASDGTPSDGTNNASAVSADGSLVLFSSNSTNLVSDDTNPSVDVFLRDLSDPSQPVTTRVSIATDGTQSNGASDVVASMSGGGRLIAFSSGATNLVSDDRNLLRDVFLRDRQTSTTTRLSVALDGINPNGESFDPSISLDGSTVAFASAATNLVADDTNAARDIFLATTGVSDPVMVVITTATNAQVGVPYGAQLKALGGTQPVFWTVAGGSLPPGLFLDSSTGSLVGMPAKAGRYHFTLLAMDSGRPLRRAQKEVILVVHR